MAPAPRKYGIPMSDQLLIWFEFALAGMTGARPTGEAFNEVLDGVTCILVKAVGPDSETNWPVNMLTDLLGFNIVDVRDFMLRSAITSEKKMMENLRTAIYTYMISVKSNAPTPQDKDAAERLLRRSMSYLQSMGARTEKAAMSSSPDETITNSTEMDYSTAFEPYNAEDRLAIGSTCYKNGQAWREKFRGDKISLSLPSQRPFELIMATEKTFVDNFTMTFNRAVCGTAVEFAKAQSKMNPPQMSKIGANVGWNGLYDYIPQIQRMLKDYIHFELYYLPLVCVPRMRPISIVRNLPDVSYWFIAFSVINDSYNIFVGKQTDYNFTKAVISKLHTENMTYDVLKCVKMINKFYPICYKKMRHGGQIPIEFVNILNDLISSLRNNAFSNINIDDSFFDQMTV